MNGKRMVVVLDGNIMQTDGRHAHSQQKKLEKIAIELAKLIKEGHQLVITYDTNPQLENMYLQQMQSEGLEQPPLSLDECTALSQGMVGYWLENALDLRLKEFGISKPVVSLVTRTEVNPADEAFWNPVWPIGPYYTEEAAKALMEEIGEIYVETDLDKGWRKVVPSPAPVRILEQPTIKALVDSGHAVICSGGGGVPVIHRRGRYIGVEGVIDLNFAARKLAEAINADVLLMLTDEDHAYVKNQTLHVIQTDEVEQLLNENYSVPGSMLPKMRAGMDFAASGPDRECIITSPDQGSEALQGKGSIKIVKQGDGCFAYI